MSREMAHKVIVPQKKIRSHSFLNSGTLVILCIWICCVLLLCVVVCCWVFLCVVVCLLRVTGVSLWLYVSRYWGGGGWLLGLPLPPTTIVYSHGCMLVGGGCYSYIRSDPSLAVSWLTHTTAIVYRDIIYALYPCHHLQGYNICTAVNPYHPSRPVARSSYELKLPAAHRVVVTILYSSTRWKYIQILHIFPLPNN